MIFSSEEFRDIFIAIIALTVVFSYNGSLNTFASFLPSAFIIVAVSFLLHELAHKAVANRYGVKALFKLWPFGVIAGLIFMLIPPLKAAIAGGVMIYPHKFGRWKRRYAKYSHFTDITIREVGIITVVGPIVNILLAGFGWVLLQTAFTGNIFLSYMVLINLWLAVTNLIPVKPLDGEKIFTWKPWFWVLLVVLSGLFLFDAVQAFYG